MARVTKDLLVERICTGLRGAGWRVKVVSPIRRHPVELRLERARLRLNVRVYVWNLTHGGKPRSKSELRIQATGISQFEQVAGAETLILGWSQELETFAGFDIERHSQPLGSSPSLQISESTLEAAKQFGIAAGTKGNQEIAVGLRPGLLGAYIENRARLHDPREVATLVQDLRERFSDESLIRIAQLSDYAELVDGGAQPVIGTSAELRERQTILERLASLEKEIEEIRRQPGMIGHNRPPPDDTLEQPSLADVAGAARGIGEELERADPKAAEIARRATILERAAGAWQRLQGALTKTGRELKDELRKKAVGAAATAIVSGGTLFHKELRDVVDAVLHWLRLILP